jgi:DME family drug/metabolite transporter
MPTTVTHATPENPIQFDTTLAHAARGRILILLAAVLWSSSGFFAKADVFAGWPGPLLAFWRAVFALIVLVPFVRRPQWSFWFIPMTLCFVGMNWAYLTAMTTGRAATAIWLQCTAPLWVLIIGVVFFKERLVRSDFLLIGFGTAGVALILGFELRDAGFASVMYGLLSGVFYAGVVLSLRLLRAIDPAWLITLNLLATVAALSPYALWSDHQPGGIQWLYLAGFGALQMGLPYLLFARGVRHVSGHEASGLALVEPILVPVWAFLVWHEGVTWPIVIGGALIFCGLLARIIPKK